MIRFLFLAAVLTVPLAPAASEAGSAVTSSSHAAEGVSAPAPKRAHQKRPGERVPLLKSLGRVAAANAAASREPAASGFVNAIQIYPYADGSLYRLLASPERVTDVALQPGETLVAVAAGDTTRWVIGDTTSGSGETKRTHVLVKPFSAGLVTNLVITTDRRAYHLNLASTSGPAMAALSWSYPQDGLLAIRSKAEVAQAVPPVAVRLAVEQLHFNYEISGDAPSWRPLRAFDDGRQTFIEFPPSIAVGEAPPLFVLGERGEAALVNYRMQGRYYVVDRIFDAAELRLGTKKQQVVRITRVDEQIRRRKGS